MALYSIDFYSECLRRGVTFKVILPNDVNGEGNSHYTRPMKTLMLLHGYCGMTCDWIWNSNIVQLAAKYDLCVILPSGENSFYLDGIETGRKYGTFVGKELLDYVRSTFHLSTKVEDTFICGFSMGGFGAAHVALQFPEYYGKFAALSSAFIVPGIKDLKPGMDLEIANYEYYKLMFGELSELEKSENNPEVLILKLLEQHKRLPEMFIACGTEDFLLEANRFFVKFLEENGVIYKYYESLGDHNFEFWNEYLEPAIKWMLE